MLSRNATRPATGIWLGLIAGLFVTGSAPAADTEEVIVHGADAISARAEQAQCQKELEAFLESRNRRIRERLDEAIKEGADVELALSEIRSRG